MLRQLLQVCFITLALGPRSPLLLYTRINDAGKRSTRRRELAMTTNDRDQLQNILDALEDLLDSDELADEEWHEINNAVHILEDLI